MFPRRRIERGRGGAIRLRLTGPERDLLRTLRAELELRLEGDRDDPDLRRLFPPAHEDRERDAEYRELVGDQLLAGRARALGTLEQTIDSETLTAEQADEWLRALNDVRLVLGTRLDVREDIDYSALDPYDPNAREFSVYAYLSWLQEQLVEALSADLGRA